MKYLLFIGCSLLVASPAWGQATEEEASLADPAYPQNVRPDAVQAVPEIVIADSRIDPRSIVVVATGSSTSVNQIGQSVSVLTADDLQAAQGPDLTRALERLPGVSFARSGGLGSQTSLFVRGANSEQLLVTIDGIRVEDVAAPSGGFDLGTLMAGGIGRVELLRGSNSLAWGSDAIGGVLALSTDARPGERASVEYGAHNTIDANAGAGLAGTGYSLGLTGGYLRSDGISAFAGGSETDPFRQWHLAARGSLDLAHGLKFVAAGRYADSRIEFDGFPPPLYDFADTPEYQTTRQGSGRVGLEYGSGGLQLGAGVALSETRRAYYDPTYGSAPNFNTIGRAVHANLTGRAELTADWALDFGGDADWSQFESTFDPHQSASLVGAHALLGYHGDRLDLTGGARIDHHDRFGDHTTLGANASFRIGGQWRLRGSWGQGFKAPTLSQLYGFGANPDLKPETSEAFDLGIEYGSSASAGRFAATLYRRDSANLIDYVYPGGYFNVSRARAEGFELEGDLAVTDRVKVQGAYTYLNAIDRSTGRKLARRPSQMVSVGIDWRTPLDDLTLGADLRLVGDSFDDRGNFTRLDGYGLLALRASLPLGEHLELYGRVENVTDARYQTVAGYGTYGRSAYGGVRVTW